MHTLERIYPLKMDERLAADQATLDLHMQRYAFASGLLSGERVLDMACGCGYGSALLAEQNPDKQITGIDIDPEAIAYAQANYQRDNLRYLCANAETFADSLGFDSIVSLETIEHLPNPQRLVDNYASLLAKGGRIIASVPTTPTLDGNPHHLHDFSPRSFYALFRRHGLTPKERYEQIQRWEFSGLFKKGKKEAREHRSEGVGNAVLGYYRRHPLYLLKRLFSILRYGPSNRYLTCRFSAD
ncbi:class I SAM-dependent methyltransferase [Phytopseudomonas punonensis]|uniref:Methyltransferase domain-containing protein n=1 Tax=Phytopseudomonas punonensis TaxID=1220495 RepID=A0A1M7HH48_9GAMM|nr:class I SAM-dependent methyltransferase [Pseudomonas punonensis]SHM27784.1 Methyltransferase domain-containing protein [Pseudomonas punonensis]